MAHKPGIFADSTSRESQSMGRGLIKSGTDDLGMTKHLRGNNNTIIKQFQGS